MSNERMATHLHPAMLQSVDAYRTLLKQTSLGQYSRATCLIHVNIDHLRRYNDQNGALVGDRLIQTLITCITQIIQAKSGMAYHLGGDTFAILHPTAEQGFQVATALMTQLALLPLGRYTYDTCTPWRPVSVSIGYATGAPTIAALDEGATQALVKAKRIGGNCIVPTTP